ncbi:hypothetical protein [Fluviispira sanaruensis]|uniref:Uncharacterized protein n=1 Tax=Fluviispira sanaruensis TaxID=2493639 RepID=A0A4P2VMT4_FLUSA|nr:hypothetical protein [Fluviispira sanaruensis]BBH52809.1 hypothetical protein JCM31447_12520 [Fluviispira sanaruensis]
MKNNKIKTEIYKALFITLTLTFATNLWAQTAEEFPSLNEFYAQHTEEQGEELLLSATGSEVKDLSRTNLVKLYQDSIIGNYYVEKIYDYYNNANKLSAKREYFAYSLDKQIDLNIVPPTLYFKDPASDNNFIVRQLYISKAHSVEGKKAAKNYNLSGTPLPIFDQLIGATDRKFNNFLIAQDGTVIAIDHESLFLDGYISNTEKFINEDDIKAFFYNKSIWEKFMSTNWDEWTEINLSHEEKSIKEAFIANINKLKVKTAEIMNHSSYEDFFSSADNIRKNAIELKKQIFFSEDDKENIIPKTIKPRAPLPPPLLEKKCKILPPLPPHVDNKCELPPPLPPRLKKL